MSSTTFVDNSPPTIDAAWLNDVNTVVYGPTSPPGTLRSDLASTTDATKGSALVGWFKSVANFFGRKVSAKLSERVSPEDFGADPTGVADSSPAFAAAIAYLKTLGGGAIDGSPGAKYLLNGIAGTDGLLNGILQPYTSDNGTTGRILLHMNGALLLAGSNNMIVLRTADSYNGGKDINIDGNGKTGVIGHALYPQDTTQTTQQVSQSFNYFSNVYIVNCSTAVAMRCGPVVAGLQSGCYYNRLSNFRIYNCLQGLWLRTATTPLGSLVNRNTFDTWRVGGTVVNTGLQIDSGDTNIFRDFHCENVSYGTSPNATPTAFKIAFEDVAAGLDNTDNKFFGCVAEACTRDLDNANSYTEFYGCTLSGSKLLLTANPLVLLGGIDASVLPQIMPGYSWQANPLLPGVDTLVLWVAGGIAIQNLSYAYDQGNKWATYAITTALCTGITSIGEYHSKFQRFGGMIDWHLRMIFQASSTSAQITITLPQVPSAQYTTFLGQQPQFFPVVLIGANGVAVPAVGEFSASNPSIITINPPAGNWYSTAFSEIHLQLRYMETSY